LHELYWCILFFEVLAEMCKLTRDKMRRCAVSASVLTVALTLGLPMPALASIVSGSILSGGPGATFVKLTVPFVSSTPANTVGNDNFQTNNLYGFDEDQNILLVAPLVVDAVPSGSTTLPIGTTVASHYVFFDPVSGSIDGLVNFDSNILAIITSTTLLQASDFLLNNGVTYLSPNDRGIEPEQGDSVTFSGARQIRVVLYASTPGDYVRVLTAFSPLAPLPPAPPAAPAENPEPGTASLFGVGAGLAALLRYRRVRLRRS
jgi:hypothetical protein